MPNFGLSAFGSTTTISASTTSAAAAVRQGDPDLMVYNAGPGLAFIRWGYNKQTAVPTDVPIPAGTVQVFNKSGANSVAAITLAGSALLYFTSGTGR